jgi:hypothetical protein
VYEKVLLDFLEVTGDLEITRFQPIHVKRYIASLGGCRADQASAVLRVFTKWLIAQNQMRYTPALLRRPSQIFPFTSKAIRNWAV